MKQPLTLDVAREQLGRLGDTPFELGEVRLEIPADAMVPKSVLNQLRRESRPNCSRRALRTVNRAALDELRRETTCPPTVTDCRDHFRQAAMYVLVRTQEQLDAMLELAAGTSASSACAGLLRFRRCAPLSRCGRRRPMRPSQPIGLATLRILKPGEEGLLATNCPGRGRRGAGPQSGGAGLFSGSRTADATGSAIFR